MDALAGLLDGPRARGAFLLRMVMEPPWSVHIDDGAPLCLMCVTDGEAWIEPADGPPVRLTPGDLAIARGPEPYTVAHRPGAPPQARIGPGGTCHTLTGEPLAQSMHLGVRTWGNARDGSAGMLIGTYQMRGEVSGRLLDALPALLHLPGDTWRCPVMDVLAEEIARDDPGQSVVLDRVLDLLLIAALRQWFAGPDARPPAWYRAMGDPVVGRALRLLQDEPARPWTVASLAAACGVSRAGLARRFTGLVGEPPMTYLTGWRLALAADLLRDGDATVEAIARKVGYGGSFAFSAAFKRVRGTSPQDYRTGRTGSSRQA
ncbi:AraC family transcriptional regulator [Streptomyces zhihengii]|uniref:AraC family transcriptional regulator n=1 Tax=Streptomyces zhihengii TaxID=1818004 RepID=A0ABS2UL59_9ACTN|nr:AraC family transcriptional regulator [Streptomyces zhihengii]MBM9618256.1 AraC family transcriptional regulator [Streptomyces zhihengii]